MTDDGFGTRARNYCWDDVDVAAARHESNCARPLMSDFQWFAWKISAGWALVTIGAAVWFHYDSDAWVLLAEAVAFQIWFVGRAVTGR